MDKIMFETQAYVVKRDGTKQELEVGAIQRRLERLAAGLANPSNDKATAVKIGAPLPHGVAAQVAVKVISGVISGVSTRELDLAAAHVAASIIDDPAYGELAARVLMANLHRDTAPTFSAAFAQLAAAVDDAGIPDPQVAPDAAAFVAANAAALDAMIVHERDYWFNVFAISSLTRGGYLVAVNGKTVER